MFKRLQDVLDGPPVADPHAMASSIAGLHAIAADQILPTRTTAEWRALFDALDIPCAPVMRMEALQGDPHPKAVGLFQEYDHPTQGRLRHMRAPFTMRDVETATDRPPPEIGHHSLEVAREIGLSEDQIAALRARGLLRQHEREDEA